MVQIIMVLKLILWHQRTEEQQKEDVCLLSAWEDCCVTHNEKKQQLNLKV